MTAGALVTATWRPDELVARKVARNASLRRAARLGRAVLGWVPVTPLGLAVGLALGGLIRSVALPAQDRILLALAVCGLAIEALSVVAVVATAVWIRVRPQGPAPGPITAEVGVPFLTGYSPGWVAWNPLVRIEVTWEPPADVRGEVVAERIRPVEQATARGRAALDRVSRRLVVADVLHLARVSFVRSREQSVTIRPASGALGRLALTSQFVPGDQLGHPEGKPEGELIEMRRYSPGDPLKLVMWKLYARTGRLMVRTAERSVSRSEATLAYFVVGDGDEASAGIARGWIESGGMVDGIAFGADGTPGATRRPDEALDRVVRSASSRERDASAFGAFLDEGEAAGVRACVLFVPSRSGPWLDRLAGILAGRPGPYRAFVGIDGLRREDSTSRLRGLLLRRGAEPGAEMSELGAVVERLAAVGAEVRVVDRVSGRVVHPDEMRDIVAKGGRS